MYQCDEQYKEPCDPRHPYHCQSVHIFIKKTDGQWMEIDTIHPHAFWDMWAADLSSVVKETATPLTVKLVWTKEHKLDFIGLENSPNIPLKPEKLTLLKAMHSRSGDVKGLLMDSDDKRTQMNKNDEILLQFSAPAESKKGMTTSYLITAEGYYTPLGEKK